MFLSVTAALKQPCADAEGTGQTMEVDALEMMMRIEALSALNHCQERYCGCGRRCSIAAVEVGGGGGWEVGGVGWGGGWEGGGGRGEGVEWGGNVTVKFVEESAVFKLRVFRSVWVICASC